MPSDPPRPVPDDIRDAIAAVLPPDPAWAERAAARQARLTMPPGSLGRLLEIGRTLASLQRVDRPSGSPALVAVFAADHGVAARGVSAYPAEVTGQMVANYLRGGAAVNVLARRMGAAVRVADLGVASLPAGVEHHPDLHSRPVAKGTLDFVEGPAMTREQAFQAVRVGLECARAWVEPDGIRVLAIGEMGIGNTTTATALLAGLTVIDPGRLVGRGTGIDDAGLDRKRRLIAEALDRHRPDPVADPWGTLAALGGFEILGLAGLAIGAARARVLVVLDGLISSVAGLVAALLCPAALGSFLASHRGTEPGHAVALEVLGLRPLFDLDLRLGEGTGATLALPWIAAAADLLRDMATFDSAGVSEPPPSS